MAGTSGQSDVPLAKPDASLVAALTDEPWRFNFFVAVQLLQRASPGAAPIGGVGPARREAVRFVHDPSLTFHVADVSGVDARVIRDGVPFAEVKCTFLGLFGAMSPFATFMSEDVLQAERAEEGSLKAFYDIFHHRIISLFYRSWKKYRFGAGFRMDGADVFTRRALSFVGVDSAAMPSEGLSGIQLLALASLLSLRTRPARSLQIILERLFPGAKVALEPFVARRALLKDEHLWKLGAQNSTLGVDFCLGRSVIDRNGRFRVLIGPVNYPLFEGLLPGGKNHQTLRNVINQFLRGALEIECEVSLSEDETPKFQLGATRGNKLGVTTRLRPKEAKPMSARFLMGDDPVQARPVILDPRA